MTLSGELCVCGRHTNRDGIDRKGWVFFVLCLFYISFSYFIDHVLLSQKGVECAIYRILQSMQAKNCGTLFILSMGFVSVQAETTCIFQMLYL